MKRFFILCQLELKRALRCLPRILLGTAVLLAAIGSVVFCGQHLLYGEQELNKAKIAFVLEDDSFFTAMAIRLATTQSASTRSACEFVFPDAEEAARELENNELAAVATIPKGFINSISSGENLPIRIDFANEVGYEALIFEEIANAAMQILGSTQAGNYAARDFYRLCDRDGKPLQAAYDRLESAYISLVLSRESVFRAQTVGATGSLNVLQFFLAGGCILFLLLWGIPCIRYLTRDSKCLLAQLRQSGFPVISTITAKFTGLGFLYLILLLCILLPAGILWHIPVLPLILTALCLLLTACSLLLFLYEISDGGIGTVFLILCSAFGLCLLSGCICPLPLLPGFCSVIARFLPTTYMMNGLTSAFLGVFSIYNAAGMLLGTAVFFSLAVLIRILRTKQK